MGVTDLLLESWWQAKRTPQYVSNVSDQPGLLGWHRGKTEEHRYSPAPI